VLLAFSEAEGKAEEFTANWLSRSRYRVKHSGWAGKNACIVEFPALAKPDEREDAIEKLKAEAAKLLERIEALESAS